MRCNGLPAQEANAAKACEALVVTERGGRLVERTEEPLLPRVSLTRPGRYCLDQDIDQKPLFDPLRRREAFMPVEAIIRIEANNVSLDLADHTISNTARPGMAMIWFSKFAVGVRGGTRLQNAHIANGMLRSPGITGVGIDLTASRPYGPRSLQIASIPTDSSTRDFFEDTRHVVESMTISAGKHGILLDGMNNNIRNNHIVVDGKTAIVAQGPGLVLEDNVIEVRGDPRGLSDHDRKLESRTPFPIRLIQADDAIIRNNRIRLIDRKAGAGLPAAIELVRSRNVTVEGNRFEGMDQGVHADPHSSYLDKGNEASACASSATRYLPPDETGGESRPRTPACR